MPPSPVANTALVTIRTVNGAVQSAEKENHQQFVRLFQLKLYRSLPHTALAAFMAPPKVWKMVPHSRAPSTALDVWSQVPPTPVRVEYLNFNAKNRLIHRQCLKFTQIIWFFSNFGIFRSIKSDLSGNTVWPQALDFQKTRQNWTIFGIFNQLFPLKM